MLSPEMFTSGSVSAWPAATRWTWAGLLCYLDDYGYGEDSAALVKASVWPRDDTYTAKKVAADLDRIAANGTVCRFSCCERPQLHAPGWDDWQKVPHPGKPRWCPCPSHAREAHEFHLSTSRDSHEGLTPNVVEVNRDQRSSSDCAHGVDRHASCTQCVRASRGETA